MSSFTINVQDAPILASNTGGSIPIAENARSQITQTNPFNNDIYKITNISICNPVGSNPQTFDIIFTHINTSGSEIYLHVPVKIGKVSEKFINKEFTEFMEDANGTKPFQFNLSELVDSISNDKFYSNNDKTKTVIRTDVIYLNVLDPTKTSSPIVSLADATAGTTVTVKNSPKPLFFHISPNTNKDNPDSKDPSRTLPIEIYDGIGNNNEIKQGITDNLSTYTGLMISSIVLGFIFATAYIIIIMIPDSKLRITKTQRVSGCGGWSFPNILRW
jgi:hypothetical protein